MGILIIDWLPMGIVENQFQIGYCLQLDISMIDVNWWVVDIYYIYLIDILYYYKK